MVGRDRTPEIVGGRRVRPKAIPTHVLRKGIQTYTELLDAEASSELRAWWREQRDLLRIELKQRD